LIEIDTNFVVRVQWPGNANQYLYEIRKDPPIDAVREMLNFIEKNWTPLQGISVKQLIHEGQRL